MSVPDDEGDGDGGDGLLGGAHVEGSTGRLVKRQSGQTQLYFFEIFSISELIPL